MNQRRNCALCDRRILNYRRPLNCNICHHEFHYKCQQLSKRDADNILDSENQNFWSCHKCTADIFPLINDNSALAAPIIENNSCHCCQRILGKRYNKSHTCDKLVHKRCFVGDLGCKNCARETFPGYEHSAFTEIFNPFDYNSEKVCGKAH